MFTRDRFRNCLTALGWIAVFLAVMPYFHYKMGSVKDSAEAEFLRDKPDLYPSTTEYRFGWTDSPLVRYHSEQSVSLQSDAGGFSFHRTSGLTVGWISWSMPTLAIGIGLLRLARLVRSKTPPASLS